MSYITRQENRITKAEYGMEVGISALNPIGKIAAWSAAHRWWVVAAFVMLFVSTMFVLSTVETKILEDNGVGESGVGAKLVEDGFDLLSAPTEQLVFSNPSLDVRSPVFRSTVQALVDQLADLSEVESVVSYYDTDSEEMVSADGHVVLAQVVVAGDSDLADEKIEAILDAVYAANASEAGFEISMAGMSSISYEVGKIDEEDFASMIIITMVLVVSLMLIAFRGVVAAIIPLVLAIGSIFVALGLAALVSQVFPMIEFLAQVVLLMGMAVGVDYSLFIVSRYRTERKAGRQKMDAIASASNTTGRAVFYAGVTVLLSLAGLIFTGSDIFISMSIGVIIVVIVALVASLTLLPAMLAILGDKVDALRLPFIGRDNGDGGGIWAALTSRVLAKPAIFAAVTTAVLVAVAIPAFTLDLSFARGSDAFHDAVQGKRALQLLEENFSAGLAAPAYVVVEASDINSPAIQDSVESMIQALAQNDAFTPPFNVVKNEAGNLLYVEVPIAAAVDEGEAEAAVRFLRSDIVAQAFAGTSANTYVSGQTAGSMDFTDQMVGSAPYVFGFVLGLAFLLLLVMFRSIVIPIKAIGLNLLSVGAAYGIVVMVFQWGWGISLLGSQSTGVIEPWLPMFLFAILFGLSMDYHMLLLNRIKEAYDEGYSNEESVARGIRFTAGQITAAAAVMVGVFGTFALSRGLGVQQMGLGLGVAVLIDATIIRSILLPASMKLLGDRNWYLPSWLEWLPDMSSSESGKERQVATEAVAAMADD
ncbi:MAG: MMPL family transporter [Chloroflexi bacterium]|nr:MMPL family transporter [Chloroflexota bacterium]